MNSGIYAIRCAVNGKVYVGSAVNITNRWAVHRHGLTRGTHHGVLLQRAWNKHGEQAFAFEVLELVPCKSNLLAREQVWIDALEAATKGYNTAPVAGSTLGKGHSEEAKLKMSLSHKRRLSTPDGRAARSAQMKELFATESAREMQAEKARRAWLDPSYRRGATERSARICSDPSWRSAHSEKIKAVWADPSRREAMSKAMRGRVSEKRKPVMLFGIRYDSMTAAAEAHGRNRAWVKARMEPAGGNVATQTTPPGGNVATSGSV